MRLVRRGGFLIAVLLAAAEVRAEEPPAPPAPVEAPSAEALAKDLASPELERRRQAAYALYGLADRGLAALPALVDALGDGDAYVRTTAEKALARIADAPPTPASGELLPTVVAALGVRAADAREPVRRGAAVALWRLSVLHPDDALAEAGLGLLGSSDADLRADGAGVLANAGGRLDRGTPLRARAVAALAQAMKDPDERVRGAVALAFGALGGSEGSGVLLALADDRVAAVRASAVAALGAVTPAGDDLWKRAAAALDDPDVAVRVAAANALWSLAPRGALDALLRALHADGEAGVRVPTVSALGAIGDLRALAAVRGALADPDVGVRNAALTSLVGFGPECAPALPDVVRVLRADPEAGLRATAAMALGPWEHGAVAAVPALLAALGDPEAQVQNAAASALFSLALADALPASARTDLLSALAHAGPARPDVTLYAAQALLRLGPLPAEAAPVLLEAYRAAPNAPAAAPLLQALAHLDAAPDAVLAFLRERAGAADREARVAALGLVTLGGEADRTRGLALLTGCLGGAADAEAHAVYLLAEAGPRAARADDALAARAEALAGPRAGWRRVELARALVALAGPSQGRAVERLREALRGDDLPLAHHAARSVGALPRTPAALVGALLDRLEPDAAEPGLCVAAARALGHVAHPDPDLLDRLARAAAIPERADLRWAATGALLQVAAR